MPRSGGVNVGRSSHVRGARGEQCPATPAFRARTARTPFEAWKVPLIAAGPCMVYIIPTDENGQGNDLICIHTTTGNELWRRPIGHYTGLSW